MCSTVCVTNRVNHLQYTMSVAGKWLDLLFSIFEHQSDSARSRLGAMCFFFETISKKVFQSHYEQCGHPECPGKSGK